MSLQEITIALVSGVIAVLVGRIIVKRPKEKLLLYTLVSLSCWMLLVRVVPKFLAHDLDRDEILEQVTHALRQNPMYGALEKYDEETFVHMMDSAVGRLREGASPVDVGTELGLFMSSKLVEYVPTASDEAAVSLVRTQLDIAEQYYAKDPSLCFCFLFAPMECPEQLGKAFGELLYPIREAHSLAIERVISSSATSHYAAPSAEEIGADLDSVSLQLGQLYGDSLDMLVKPSEWDKDRDLMCRMTIDMFKCWLGLPETRAGKLARWAFYKGATQILD